MSKPREIREDLDQRVAAMVDAWEDIETSGYNNPQFFILFQYVVELDDRVPLCLLPHPIWIVVIYGAIFFD